MFHSEQQLVDDVSCFLQSPFPLGVPIDLKNENQILLQEVNLGYGIADIVLTQTIRSPEKRDKFLNLLEIKLLKIITENPGIKIEIISEKTKLPKKKIVKAIKKLESLSLAKNSNDGIRPLNKYVSIVKNTIAIEAKLRNWQRALKQAYRYKWFSNKTFVCLPIDRINPAFKNIEKFEKMGVGLVGFCEKNGFQMLYNHRSEEPVSDEMATLLNECVLSALYAS